jgi:2-polyprenyl-3-methyl-5-hydroxy-6-metoxy-1,4-benzoquinol methylase
MSPNPGAIPDRDCSLYLHRSLYHRGVAEREEEFVVNMLRPRQEHVLEVGPGTGRLTRHLVELSASLTVCDRDEEILQKLRDRLGTAKQTYYPIALENLVETPGYGGFDAAVAVRVVPHAADWQDAIKQLTEAVRPGGLVIFDLWSRQSFVGALMKLFPRPEPVAVHRLTRREIHEAAATLQAELIAAYRWGYPRLGPFHLDDLGSILFPSAAYSTLFCFRRR